MLNDSRNITSLTAQTNDETNYWTIGTHGVIKICIEAIQSHQGIVPWFAIQYDNGNFCRINGSFVYAIDYSK